MDGGGGAVGSRGVRVGREEGEEEREKEEGGKLQALLQAGSDA